LVGCRFGCAGAALHESDVLHRMGAQCQIGRAGGGLRPWSRGPGGSRIGRLPAKQPREGRRDNRPLEESPDTVGQGGREADPGKPAGKCHRNTPPKRRAAREPGAGKGEKVR
jgi:hypothetical protein